VATGLTDVSKHVTTVLYVSRPIAYGPCHIVVVLDITPSVFKFLSPLIFCVIFDDFSYSKY
jgi:hypothetical protein